MSTTSRELWHRLWTLLALALVTTLALFGSYQGVHTDAVPLASSTASGVIKLDTARDALVQAQNSALLGAAIDEAGISDFSTKIAVANQNLAEAAAEDVTGPTGQQTLQTIVGLVSSYAAYIGYAGQEKAASAAHAGFMKDAIDTLGATGTHAEDATVMGRLYALHQDQLAVVDRQARFGWALWLGWGLTAVLAALLLAALVEAQLYTRLRFGRRWNRRLVAAAALLVAGAAVLAAFTWQTHTGLFHARTTLRGQPAGSAISRAGASVARVMAGTGFRAAAADGIVVGGVLLMALIVWGLLPGINEYRYKVSR